MSSSANGPDVPSGPCEDCGNNRPLWRYRPAHTTHLHEPARMNCTWCTRTDAGVAQPLLCVRCWSAESELEARTPITPGEQAAVQLIIGAAPARRAPAAPPPAGPRGER